jgi:TPR repeat protein
MMIRYSFWWLDGRTVRAACSLLAACMPALSFAQQAIVGAETFEEARSFIADSESLAARDLLTPWAQAGSTDAQFELGRLYASDSTLKDDLLARRRLRRAELQDHIEALMLLGASCYNEDLDYTLRQSLRA